MHLPPLVFVGVNIVLFATTLSHVRTTKCWWLPFLFVALNVLYVLANFWLFSVSWRVSDLLVGPPTSAYKGYDRTWYGIVLHLVLWFVFYAGLLRISWKLKVESPTLDRQAWHGNRWKTAGQA
jgi:hypothetical protein